MSEYEFEDAVVTTTSQTGQNRFDNLQRKAASEIVGQSGQRARQDFEDYLRAIYRKTRSE